MPREQKWPVEMPAKDIRRAVGTFVDHRRALHERVEWQKDRNSRNACKGHKDGLWESKKDFQEEKGRTAREHGNLR